MSAPAQEALIACEGLVRIFKTEGVEVVALQGLDLRVDAGELLAVVGASGSGKSTLLNILSGHDVPSAGTARVAGADLLALDGPHRLEYRRRTVGFVWQQTGRNLVPYLSAEENVGLPMLLAGSPRKQRTTRTGELLELLGVRHRARHRPAQLSGGEQQRVAIAVALANAPQVLFADEPTGELDSHTAAEVFAALRTANEQLGVTVVVVTHDAQVSTEVRRTVAIRDGRTSSEVLRRVELDEHGDEQHVAEEYAVLDRAGRMQLPSEFVDALALERRVRLALEPDHVGVWPDRAGHAPPPGGTPARPRDTGLSDPVSSVPLSFAALSSDPVPASRPRHARHEDEASAPPADQEPSAPPADQEPK